MEITTVHLARILYLFPGGLELSNRMPMQEARKLFVDRYGFMKAPNTVEEWTHADGAVFSYGRHQGIVINKLVLYARGVSVETSTDTVDAEKIIQDLLVFGTTELRLNLTRASAGRKIYLSQLTFVSDLSLNAMHPALRMLGERVSPFAQSVVGDRASYQATGITLNVDDSNLKFGAGPFTIARREGIPFAENSYFSSAPMPTADHKKALEDFESLLKP